ncbi:MAG: tetratricopeptide repeat protein, partial [Deltaproteobacteria bacterium]|nr:tetratricopeptide repeat protein [Deltaproteobacteria bacterium]
INSFKTDENLFEYAYFLQRHNQFNKAIPLYKEVLQIYRGLAKVNPQAYLPYVANTLNNLGNLQQENNKTKEAFESHKEALQIRRELSETNPQAYLPDVAMTLINLSIFYLKFEPDRDKSIAYAQEVLDLLLSFPNKTHAVEQYIEKAKTLLRLNKKE